MLSFVRNVELQLLTINRHNVGDRKDNIIMLPNAVNNVCDRVLVKDYLKRKIYE